MAKEEKTEKPTPQRLKEARKEGQVARTQELGAWATMGVLAMVLPKMLFMEANRLTELMGSMLRVGSNATTDDMMTAMGLAFWHVLVTLGLLGGAVLLISVAATIAQGGMFIATKAAKPSAKKLNPIKGAVRIFGPNAAWEGAKMLLKSAVVAVLVYRGIIELMPMLGGLIPMAATLGAVKETAGSLFRAVAVAGLLMAGLDYVVQRHKIGKQTRMTKQEIKQEHKQSEGDPLIKSAIRSRQMAASRQRMMAAVPEADVLLVNPTHIAIALRYEPTKGAPRVVARGAGAVATRIREKAAEAGVPIVRDVPLARALYKHTQVGQEVPVVLFAAVAHILAWVMSRSAPGSTTAHAGRVQDSPRGEAPVPAVPRGRAANRRALMASGPAT